MADYFKAGIFNILDEDTNTYNQMLAIKGDPGPVPTEDVLRPIVASEIAKVVADAPEDFDTLKEISDWISSHEDDASAMNTTIQQNASDISDLQSDISDLQSDVQDNTSDIGDIQSALENIPTFVFASGTITSGNTSIVLTNENITTSMAVDVYFQDKVLSAESVVVASGSVTITINAQDTDTVVGVRCSTWHG